ncbi:MAG: Txe/YoeB family addiction module toxin [Gammaproteobacteria bacterium]|nr:Txe/YoeB family addiction module toxin [Gammaproteobacteria bacterium]
MPVAVEVWWSRHAREDIAYWRRRDPSLATRIEALIADIKCNPFTGLGKPEPLKHALAGFWSRRITKEHRLVYRVEAGVIYIAQCRFHYDK